MVVRKRILTAAAVAGIGTTESKFHERPDQITVAGTGLGKGLYATQVRNQRQHWCPRHRIETSLAALKVGSLTHLLPVLSKSGQRGFPNVPLTAEIAEIAETLFRLNSRIFRNFRY
jgi:hypothetical protein